MPMINPKTGKPYPNTPAGKAASQAEYDRQRKANKKKKTTPKKRKPGSGSYKTPKPPVKKPKSRGY